MAAPLREALGDYLTMRRALGYRLVRPEKLLTQFLDHLEQTGASTVTVDAALAWACLPAGGDVNWWAYRLSVVAVSLKKKRTLDPTLEVPAPDLLPWRARRASVPVFAGGHHRAAGRGRVVVNSVAARDDRDADRAAGRDRDAGR
jgi:hypothetical protein